MNKTYTIQRSRWGFGANGGELRNAAGQQCCLGFVCEQEGILPVKSYPFEAVAHHLGGGRSNVVAGNSALYDPEQQVPEGLQAFVRRTGDKLSNTELSRELAEINDQQSDTLSWDTLTETYVVKTKFPTQAEREQRLIDRAAADGITFVFVD